jgi:4-amino-4-deoxy-L-arabinose transferase-like glycosyltransferase
VIYIVTVGPIADEAYYWDWGQHPGLSYFDHPPLSWWLPWASAQLLGTEAPLAVRLPFIALFALTTWLMFALTKLLFDERAGLWAALTLNLAPVLAWTSGSWVLPDGPLNAALLAGAYCAAAAIFLQRAAAPAWWLAAGACGGLALLSKLHGVFLFAGIALFLATSRPHRHWLASPWPYAGFALAILLFLPVIVWNAQHDWASFAFQAGRARLQEIKPWAPFQVLAGQAAYLLPWLWLPLIVSLGGALLRGPAEDRRWLLACLAIGPIAVFTLVAWSGRRVLPHWAMPGYLMLFPLLGANIASLLAAGDRRVRYWLACTAASLILILASVIALAHLPWPPIATLHRITLRNPLEEATDWTDLTRELELRGMLGSPRLLIAATRWHEAGKIDYALRGRMPVICLCSDARGYALRPRPPQEEGANVLIVGRGLSADTVKSIYANDFATIEELPPVAIKQAGAPSFHVALHLGRGFRVRAQDGAQYK